jgi:hypothetical protein
LAVARERLAELFKLFCPIHLLGHHSYHVGKYGDGDKALVESLFLGGFLERPAFQI